MEHVADDIEILDELLDEAPNEPTPMHRFQGIFLFFSISLGALGLGASLAYFTREIRPARRVARRAPRATRRAPAPSTPGLRELVTLPLKPALEAGGEALHPPPSPARPVRTASLVAPVPPPRKVSPAVPASPRSTAPAAPTQETTGTAAAPTAAPRSPATSPAPEATGPVLLAEDAAARARAFLGKLAGLLEARYAHPEPALAKLAEPGAPLERIQRVELPSWMNMVYLQRLARRALAAVDQTADRLEVEPGKFGAGTLRLSLASEASPGLALELVKPAATTQVALVVDDVGYGGSSTRELLALQAPFSVAILPFYPGSTWSLKTSIERDLEPMLHLPMMPKGAIGKYRNDVVIGPDLAAAEIQRRARRAIESLPGILGINNHMGSRATESWFVMGEVLPVIRDKRLFFVDSVTSNRSVAYRSAQKLGLPTAKRTTGFLDNDPSYEGVKAAFAGLLQACKPGQRHLAILHDKHDSVRAMREAIPLFRERDIELAFAGDMVE